MRMLMYDICTNMVHLQVEKKIQLLNYHYKDENTLLRQDEKG
jgi:hypothetical protein